MIGNVADEAPIPPEVETEASWIVGRHRTHVQKVVSHERELSCAISVDMSMID